MKKYQQALTAGITYSIVHPGANFFRLHDASSAVDVRFWKGGTIVGDSQGMEAGLKETLTGGFDKVEIVSASPQTIIAFVGMGDVGADRVTGDVAVALAETVQNDPAVTVGVAEVAVVAANTARRGLRIRSPLSNVASIFIGATGITTANGCVELQPGDTWNETQAPGGAWFAISGTAAQAVRVQELF